jgi:hypothetical protein
MGLQLIYLRRRTIMKNFPLSLILVVLIVTACGSKPKPTHTSPPPTETLEPTATPILRPSDGTYATKITKEELMIAGMDESMACENAGKFELTLSGDRWDIVQTAAEGCTVLNPTFGGSVVFTADQAAFHDDEPFGCLSDDYIYKWRPAGSGLRFTVFDDAQCVTRVYFMSQYPWIRTK